MSKSDSFEALKAQLVRKEKLYKGKISQESDVLEEQTKKILKSSAIVGASLVLAFGVFKLLAGKENSEQKPNKKKRRPVETANPKNAVLKAAITDKVVAFAIHLGLRYLSKKIRSNDKGDSQSTAA